MEVRLLLQVTEEAELGRRLSKSPEGQVFLVEGDDESADGFCILAKTNHWVEKSVGEFIQTAVYQLENEVPEQLKYHPSVIEQVLLLKTLLASTTFTLLVVDDGAEHSWFGPGSGMLEEVTCEKAIRAETDDEQTRQDAFDIDVYVKGFQHIAHLAMCKEHPSGSALSADGQAWFDSFVSYNVDEYLPSLFRALAQDTLPAGAWPKYFKLQTDYSSWVDDCDVKLHPGVQALQQHILTVRKELEGLKSWAHDYEGGSGTSGKWQMSEFLQFGKYNLEAIEKCPVTWQCLQCFDLDNSFGEVFVSTLKPFASLHVHTGETGLNHICHFGLDIPDGDLEMVVNGEGRKWQLNEGIIFNDAYPHFSYNNTDQDRAVLLIEHWNPEVPVEVRPLLSRFTHMFAHSLEETVKVLHNIEENFTYDKKWTEKLKAVVESRQIYTSMQVGQEML